MATTFDKPQDPRPELAVRHEAFCQPTGERDAVRIESYIHYDDDPKSGRAAPVKRVTRCLECGESRYDDV